MKGRILITGITGMIGGMLARSIIESEEYKSGKAKVIGVSRDVTHANEVLSPTLRRAITLVEGDITDVELFESIGSVDTIVHCAAETTSKKMVDSPVEVADGIILGTRNVLEYARKSHVENMIYLSSMEVYGVVDDIGRPRTEEELGDIDESLPRNCYPIAKRVAESYCRWYYSEYNLPVKIARLAQTFGKGVRQSDQRVYMQFARSVVKGEDIVLKTEGNSIGNYCDIEDVVNAIEFIMEYGESGEVYNVVNEKNTMCIRDMAKLVAHNIASGAIEVRIEKEEQEVTGYASDTGLRMSASKLEALGWKPVGNLEKMYEDVINELR